jgi:putative ABC transport system permease protein
MHLLFIAWRNLQHRWFASLLTMLSMTLGVTLVVLVLSVSGLIEESFERNSNIGYNLLVGPKGSPLQLTMNSVFYLSRPVGTLPYNYLLEYLPGDGRQKAYKSIGGKLEDPDRGGKYSMFVNNGFAIPICLGDYVGRFRIVGTTSEFFTSLRHGRKSDQEYRFAKGRNFQEYNEKNGYFEAVVGSIVANELDLKLGSNIFPTHGPEGETHSNGFLVVGILEPTGTPTDRATFVNIEGFYLLEGHVAPERDEETGIELPPSADEPEFKPADKTKLPIEKREVSAILVKTQGFAGVGLMQQINKSKSAQAVSPVSEIYTVKDTFFSPIRLALLALTIMVCVVSAISILVSIYNSMNERTHDIAVMRALGASRDRVLLVILCESLLISLGGGVMGWVIGHTIGVLASPMVEHRAGIRIGFFSINSFYEPWIIPGLILIGVLAGLLPAIMAYRTDVSKSLQS